MKYLVWPLFSLVLMFNTYSYAACMKNSGVKVQEYVYDFAVDGGATGNHILSAKAGQLPVPVGSVIKGVTAKVVTAVTSGGSATAEWGTLADTDGYSGTAIAKATLVAGYIQNGWVNAGALIWDNSNDVQLYPYVSVAADGALYFVINVAALTAGKINFLVEYYCPSL